MANDRNAGRKPKLTPDMKKQIFEMYDNHCYGWKGDILEHIKDKFNVSEATVYRVLREFK